MIAARRERVFRTRIFFEKYGSDWSVDFLPTVDMKQPRPRSTKYGLSYQRLSEMTGKSLSALKRAAAKDPAAFQRMIAKQTGKTQHKHRPV
jgi:hypothetical protein